MTMRTTRAALLVATLAGTFCGLLQVSFAAPQPPDAGATAQVAGPEAGEAAARLNKKEFRDIKVTENHGIVTLTGTVDLYAYKADADKRVRKANGVTAVHNMIEVAGPNLPDEVLGTKIADKLAYDRVFYGNAFNAISVSVQNGAVTLGGHALSFNSRDSALALVDYYPGVKDVYDRIEVDPVSLFDNRIRMQVFRAVYGFPSLSRYAIDPAKPIRISVQNGHVELYGMVDSQGDKETAFIRANAVPGVFDVKNYLQVADAPAKKQK
ncbi:MAG: BON domain-containing protein [Terracidiphilus sp.]|jgi:osmotically-inducible protein OsmY